MIRGVDTITHPNHSELPCLGITHECQIPSKCLHGIFNHDNLTKNYQKLHQYYERKLSPEELDERHFIQSERRNNTPFKMSPFAVNTHLNRQMPPTPTKSILSEGGERSELEPPGKRIHSGRVLNYEGGSNIDGSNHITLD